MRYAKIDEYEVVNGKHSGISLYVQGCPHGCPGCFNPETWDFNGGVKWTKEMQNKFLNLVNRPYIKRITILGGEPLADENVDGVLALVSQLYLLFDSIGERKSIYLYTGYTWEEIWEMDYVKYAHNDKSESRKHLVSMCDVLIDGRFEEDKKDLSLAFRGSANQRIIDVKKSLKEQQVILYGEI